jgi:type III pantothenate kinase
MSKLTTMLLAIDVGNTHTVLGIFRRSKPVADWRIASATVRTEDEVWLVVKLFLGHASMRARDIKGVVISSVVPELTTAFEDMAKKHLHLSPLTVSAELDVGMPVRYENPRAVGADRICNAVAAFAKYGGPCIVLDFGTATTYDVISKKGEYLGGVIAPGVETAAAELHRRAAMLPKVKLQFPESVVGTNTVSAMQAGILLGALDAMEGMIRRIKKEIGGRAVVVATGGFSSLIAQHTTAIDHIVPPLVLEGARIIYGRLKGRKRKD